MTKVRNLALAVIVMILLSFSYLPVEAESWERQVNVTIVAVSEATGRGVLINMVVKIKPGTGKVTVEAGEVDDTTRYSMIQAAVTGTVLAGRDWSIYDYEFRFINASSVSGPSASAAAATTVYLMMTGSPLLYTFANKTVMTGAITPVGLFSAIGGVSAKCQAAASAGMLFLYPTANYVPTIPGCNGRYDSVAGVFGAIEVLENITLNVTPPLLRMPPEFDDSMRNASLFMVNATLAVLQSLRDEGINLNNSPIYAEIANALNESNMTRDTMPYVSASKAFYALYNAYTLYYMAKEQATVTGIVDFVQSEAEALKENLSRLEEKLSRLPVSGSSYYVEFLGIGYARIASALAELEKAPVLAETNPIQAIQTLAYAKARIYSVISWLSSAKAVQYLEPTLSTSDVMRLASTAGDYAHISVDYSVSIASYMIEEYKDQINRALLETGIRALGMIVSKGDTYLSQGNYIAALGFYREALSQSMNDIFGVVISNFTNITKIYKEYINETIRIYSELATTLTWKGLPPGLAPAYMQYALYEKQKGNLETSLSLARSALASLIIWQLYSVATTTNMTLLENPGLLEKVPGGPGGTLSVILMAGLAGFLIATIVLGSLYRRALEKTVQPLP